MFLANVQTNQAPCNLLAAEAKYLKQNTLLVPLTVLRIKEFSLELATRSIFFGSSLWTFLLFSKISGWDSRLTLIISKNRVYFPALSKNAILVPVEIRATPVL